MDASIEVPIDRFSDLASGPSATQLVLLESLGLTKGSTLTIYEINGLGSRTGVFGTGVVAAIAAGQFYSLPSGYNQYYLNPLRMSQWIDYSAISSITGWASFTVKKVFYKIDGNILFWAVDLNGASNATTISFTLPVEPFALFPRNDVQGRVMNNGVIADLPGFCIQPSTGTTFSIFRTNTGLTWANVGTKSVRFSGFYRVNY